MGAEIQGAELAEGRGTVLPALQAGNTSAVIPTVALLLAAWIDGLAAVETISTSHIHLLSRRQTMAVPGGDFYFRVAMIIGDGASAPCARYQVMVTWTVSV